MSRQSGSLDSPDHGVTLAGRVVCFDGADDALNQPPGVSGNG
jgi:hypothetical protein